MEFLRSLPISHGEKWINIFPNNTNWHDICPVHLIQNTVSSLIFISFNFNTFHENRNHVKAEV